MVLCSMVVLHYVFCNTKVEGRDFVAFDLRMDQTTFNILKPRLMNVYKMNMKITSHVEFTQICQNMYKLGS